MGLTSCSPPLSAVNPTARRRVSLFQSHRYCQKSLPFSTTGNCTTSCSSSTSDYFGGSLSLPRLSFRRTHPVSLNKSKRSFFVVSGIFEKFTERAIKAVMFSQREAKALGKDMVFTQHLLLGLMAEDRDSGGFLREKLCIVCGRRIMGTVGQPGMFRKPRRLPRTCHSPPAQSGFLRLLWSIKGLWGIISLRRSILPLGCLLLMTAV